MVLTIRVDRKHGIWDTPVLGSMGSIQEKCPFGLLSILHNQSEKIGKIICCRSICE